MKKTAQDQQTTWLATYDGMTFKVAARLWYDARNEAARYFCTSPMDVTCVEWV